MATVEEINARLSSIAQEHNLRILYAAEVGSRAWGFNSEESDYDVRFVYVRPPDDYITIEGYDGLVMDENTGLPRTGKFDFVGWDLTKLLGLAFKSNPQVLEWFNSPTIYTKDDAVAGHLVLMVARLFCPVTARRYYWSMASRNNLHYFTGRAHEGQRRLEKYLHTIRALLMIYWLERFPVPSIPIEFTKLINAVSDVIPTSVLDATTKLLNDKMAGTLDLGKNIPELDAWVETELRRPPAHPTAVARANDAGPVNTLLQRIVLNRDIA
jgi:predicted nucleotidyltransferase